MSDATQVAIIYAANSKIIRRIILAASDNDINAHQPGIPGEILHTHPLSDIQAQVVATGVHSIEYHCRNVIKQHTGVTPPSSRVVLVNPNTQLIEGSINADPDLDTHPTCTLILSDVAQINWKYDGKQFLKRYAVCDANGTVQSFTWSNTTPVSSLNNRYVADSTNIVGGIIDTSSVSIPISQPLSLPSQGTKKL